jgi:AraC-like DNA-binding protein
MKEILPLSPDHNGAIWQYRNSGRRHPVHHHAELEINLVLRGNAVYLLNDRRYEVSRHTLIWLFPAQEHVLLEQSPDHEMWIVVWRPKLVQQLCASTDAELLCQSDPAGDFCKQLGEAPARRLSSLYVELLAACNDTPRFNAGLGYGLLAAWAAHQEASLIASGAEVHPAVERAARTLRDKPTLAISAVAKQAGLSASRLSRLFHQQTGVSLVEFRNRQRLERFLAEYDEGQRLNMTEAALAAGFGSYPQFHRVFCRAMRYSPAVYRRKLLKG